MTTPPKPDHEKRPFRFKLEGPFLRVSTMLLITPILPAFKGLKCSVFGCFRALQSRNIYGIMINNRRSPRNHHLPCFHNDVRIRRRQRMNREIVIDKEASRSRSTRWPRPATRARANSVVCLRRPCTRRRLTSSCITASRRVSRSFAAPISPSRRSRAASGSAARAIIPRCSGSLCSAPPPNTTEITPRSRRLDAAKPERQPSWLPFGFYIPAAAGGCVQRLAKTGSIVSRS